MIRKLGQKIQRDGLDIFSRVFAQMSERRSGSRFVEERPHRAVRSARIDLLEIGARMKALFFQLARDFGKLGPIPIRQTPTLAERIGCLKTSQNISGWPTAAATRGDDVGDEQNRDVASGQPDDDEREPVVVDELQLEREHGRDESEGDEALERDLFDPLGQRQREQRVVHRDDEDLERGQCGGRFAFASPSATSARPAKSASDVG